jgi:hypothetical protein
MGEQARFILIIVGDLITGVIFFNNIVSKFNIQLKKSLKYVYSR